MNKFNLQLFSVRNALKNDFEAALKNVADMGYDGVESFGYYGDLNGTQLAKMLDFYGLELVSAHVSLEELQNNLDYHAAILAECGCHSIVCPYAKMDDEQQAVALGQQLDKLSEQCIMKGMTLFYHNHSHEFKINDNGDYLFDIMMENAGLLLPEFDVFWLEHAGVNIDSMLRKYAGKINLLHLKQMKDYQSKQQSTLAEGVIDFAPIMRTARMLGTEHFIVEQDEPVVSELDDARCSVEFIKKLKV